MLNIHGLPPVHIATASENVLALRTMLCLDPRGIAENLKDRKNKDGITPLEELESVMRSMKEPVETLVCVWSYSDEALSRRWGCRWWRSGDGWLSPRMRFQLLGGRQLRDKLLYLN